VLSRTYISICVMMHRNIGTCINMPRISKYSDKLGENKRVYLSKLYYRY